MRKMGKKRYTYLFIFLLISAVAAGAYYYYHVKNNMKAKVEIPTITIEKVALRDIVTKINVYGKVTYDAINSRQVKVSLDKKSLINSINVTVGDKVFRNQKLIEIYDTELENSKFELKEAENRLKEMTLSVEESKLELAVINSNYEASVQKNKKEYANTKLEIIKVKNEMFKLNNDIKNLKSDIESAKISLKHGVSSKQELEILENNLKQLERETEFKNSELVLHNANLKTITEERSNLEINKKLKLSEHRNKLANKNKEIELAKFNIKHLNERINKLIYSCLSPIDGTVTNIEKDQNMIFIDIADISNIFVQLEVPVHQMEGIDIGRTVKLIYKGLEVKEYKGKVSKIYPTATKNDKSESIFLVNINLLNKDKFLRVGYKLEGEIITNERKDVVSVSLASILEEDDKTYVFVLKNNNTVEKREVKLGSYSESYIAVENLSEGEKVVTDKLTELTNGMKVEVGGPKS